MKIISIIQLLSICLVFVSCTNSIKDNKTIVSERFDSCYELREHHTGNSLKIVKQEADFYIDKVDDTLNYTEIKENLYQDKFGKIYIKCKDKSNGSSDKCPLISIEYFKDYTDFVNLEDYKLLENQFFINDGKVFIWWMNSETIFPIEIEQANPNTFKVFENNCCGYDDKALYYGNPSLYIKQILVDNPESVEFLSSSTSCWNCDFHYVKIENQIGYITYTDRDDKYNLSILEGVTSDKFRIVDGENWDAEFGSNKFYKGQKIIDTPKVD